MSARPLPPHPAHGGDPEAATGAAGDWLDLSTGINPHAYPLPPLRPEDWTRLPDAGGLARLQAAARACYRAPPSARLVAAPGSEALIHLLPALFETTSVAVLGPTYASHAWAWRAAGHDVCEVAGPAAVPAAARIVVLANPNNPDGRILPTEAIEALRVRMEAADGWLVIDEAFADLAPPLAAAPLVERGNVVVLRSFGKFFGLAGLRLGFAVAPPALAERVAGRLGAWAVSGPAIAIAARALADAPWQEAMRARLAGEAEALDRLLAGAGLGLAGGTDLFRLVEHVRAGALYEHLAARRIYVRRFADDPRRLRVGLPPDAGAATRLAAALAAFPARD